MTRAVPAVLMFACVFGLLNLAARAWSAVAFWLVVALLSFAYLVWGEA